MGVFRQFPYSNFHEMNMDEIIKIVKNMLEEWAQYYAEWDAWMEQINDDWSNYQEVMNEAWQNMQNFINNYFNNLDVQEEINNKIISMVNSGEFANIVRPYIPPEVTSWLTEHITEPVGVVIDTSLTVAGACADAKTTGDAIIDLKSDLNSVTEPQKNLFNKNRVQSIDAFPNAGVLSANANAKTIYIPCKPDTTYTVSKTSATARFSVAYTVAEPDVGVSVYGTLTYNNNTAITITTGSSATHLIAFIYLSTADTLTFAQICDMLQIEVGSSATAYEPYKLSAIDSVARNSIKDFKTYPVIESDSTSVSLGSELITDFSNLTPIGTATYNDGKWTIPGGSGVSTTINVVAWKTYLIDIGYVSSDTSDDSEMYKVNPLTISLGGVSINIFTNADGNFKVGLTANITGGVTLSLNCSEALDLVINDLSVKQVLSFADITMMINNNAVCISEFNGGGKNFAIGNGLRGHITGESNTALGHNAQNKITTGYRNTALGAYAQSGIIAGCANVGIGDNVQILMEGGMFNNAVGSVAQRNVTIGSWNNAMGNEAQRNLTTGCNNVSVGRRAHSYITSGSMNVALGALSGFATENHQDGSWATITSNFQTLVGGETTKASNNKEDYVTAIGYRAKGNEKSTSLGANTSALGEKSIAIGYGVTATNDNDVVIGDGDSSIILAGKLITFNDDGTVTWTSI